MSYIVIPMAGKSSRFFSEGFALPKYQLPIKDRSMFLWSVESFKNYFLTDKFIFVCREDFDTPLFIKNELSKLNISSFTIVVLDHHTLGQAETVYQAFETLNLLESDEDFCIFNIDSRIEYFRKAQFCSDPIVDGYLEVFKSDGDHWSFVQPGDFGNVLYTTENPNSFFLRRLNRDLYQYDNNIPITEARVLLSVYMEIPAD